jgi:hypothetical protein
VTYRIAGIDVHKRMLAVVIADVAVEGKYQFERRRVGTSPSELCRLAEWLVAEQVAEVGHGIDRAILATSLGVLSFGFPHRRQFPSGLPFFLFGSFSFFVEKISFHNIPYATFGAQGELRVAGFVDDFEAAALDLEV